MKALGLLTSMFNPLPAIALLPIALLWFGIGTPSLIFVIVHSVLWPVALACHGGFLAVPPTLRMAGAQSRLVRRPLRGGDSSARGISSDPVGSPDRLGLRLAHADRSGTGIRRQRTLRRNRLVHLHQRAQLETASVFAGLLTVILIGLVVEGVIFRTLTRITVQRWGQEQT